MASGGWLYDEVLKIWGPSATIIPYGAPVGSIPGGVAGENPARTTVTTYPGASGLSAVFTYRAQAAPLWAKQPYVVGKRYGIPAIRPDGTANNIADTPDNAYWSFNNNPGTNTDKAFSVGWIWKPMTAAAARMAFCKYGGAVEEYQVFALLDVGLVRVQFSLTDTSAGVTVYRRQDADFTLGQWHTFAATYDGGGGATAMNGVIIYMDGAVMASTATNNAAYVAMENGALLPTLGCRQSTAPANRWIDDWAGGPFGVVVSVSQLTAANIASWDALWKQYGLKSQSLLRKIGGGP